MSPSKDVPSSNGITVSAPPLASRKRRHAQISANDERGPSKPKRSVSTVDLKNGGSSSRPAKRRRASSPGLRKSAPKRMPSASDSQLDADGETDPDVVEVEDELMQVSPEDPEEDNASTRHAAPASGSADGSKKISFDDLEHFYSGNPIDIDQHADEQVAVQKPGSRPPAPSPPPAAVDDVVPDSQAPTSPALSSSDPLFGSPPRLSEEVPESQRDSPLPPHRARVANPRIKLIDTTTPDTIGKQSRITAKARLISVQTTDSPSTSGSSGVVKRGSKPGPGRSSAGLVGTKNRSSLLTATKGALKSVKGKFAGTTVERDQTEEIEEASAAHGRTQEDKLLITSWSDDNLAVDKDHQVSNPQPDLPPSGDELLKLAGLQTDMETLPDYEDDSATQPQDVETKGSSLTLAPTEEGLAKSPVEGVMEDIKASDLVAGVSPAVAEAKEKASTPGTTEPSVPPAVAPPADEAVKLKYGIPLDA